MTPALAVVLHLVMSLRPREYWAASQPVDAAHYDWNIWSQLGFLDDPFVGLDAGNLVYVVTWCAIARPCGLGSAWGDSSLDIGSDELPPRPDKQGRRRRYVSGTCMPANMSRTHPGAWARAVCRGQW